MNISDKNKRNTIRNYYLIGYYISIFIVCISYLFKNNILTHNKFTVIDSIALIIINTISQITRKPNHGKIIHIFFQIVAYPILMINISILFYSIEEDFFSLLLVVILCLHYLYEAAIDNKWSFVDYIDEKTDKLPSIYKWIIKFLRFNLFS